ncbi:uncharacterized protein LOC127716653 isoform X2 [Mytilus californianus]|uniref:uncharacterized protein LOC127716653 isoform X2 n=1 Tax=Mytilus californianus TaxID=6549 RepID=UPI002246D3B2|nr:uncharacterized protein LOC127716653 isoform X2 [Mytilus californianus]
MAQTSTTKCSLCETNNGMYFCYECKSALCGPCRKTHDKIPATQSHSITDLKRIDRSMFSSVSSCTTHKQEFSLYCTTCNILICSKCVATKHKGHDFSEIEPVVGDLRISLKKQIKEMYKKIEKLSFAVDDIRTVRLKALEEDANQLRSKVHLAILDVQNVIEKQKEIKITEIDDFEKFEKQELEIALAAKERILNSCKTLQTSLGKMLDEEHSTTFLTSYKTMKSDFDEDDDGLQEINNYKIPSVNTESVSKDVTTAVIQHFKNSMHSRLSDENSLETDGDGSTTAIGQTAAQQQHVTGDLLNFITDVTNFDDESEQQKAELIYAKLVAKENELKDLLTKERVVAVEYKDRTSSKYVKKTNCLFLNHDSYRKQLTDVKTNRIFQKAHDCIEIKGATISNKSSSTGTAVVADCLTKESNYFEVVIVNLGVNGIGVVSESYGVVGAPGWHEGSVAIHVDDGTLHNSEGVGTPFGPKANIGDIIGCGIVFPSTDILENSEVDVFFTLNSEKIGSTKFTYPSGGLFPAVGMHVKDACARFHLRGMWNASAWISEDQPNKTDDQEFNEATDSSNEDSLFSKSMFKKSMEENVLITALKSRMEHCSEAADAAWEYYNLKRSLYTLQSLQK